MNPIVRLLLPAVVLLMLGLASAVVPGRAQPASDVRLAFADTTLLRDTLDLRFDGLFDLADSLGVLPDTLRALSIRYLLPLQRLVALSDSLRVPVDSVGPFMERERYNPLAASIESSNDFRYGSTYSIGRQNSSWVNTSDYNLVHGPVFVRNVTNISVTRTRQVGGTSEYRTRNSNTEAGWRFSENFAVGGRVNLKRTENSAISRVISNDEYQLSVRLRQQPHPNLTTQFNAFGGPFTEPNSTPEKRGMGVTLQGTVTLTQGGWLTHDLDLRATERRGDGRQPGRDWVGIHDYTRGLNGTLNLFPALPLSMRLRYDVQENRTERPNVLAGADYLSRDESYGNGIEGDIRLRGSQDRYVVFSGRIADTKGFLELARKDRFVYEPTIGKDRSMRIDGRYNLRGWTLDATFSNAFPSNDGPAQGAVTDGTADTTVDYRERDKTHTRNITGTVSRALARGLLIKATGTVTLSSYRYEISDSSYRAFVDGFVTPTAPREDYRQSYKIEGTYARSSGLVNGIELEVARSLNMFLVGSRSAQNTEDRTYRAVWRWTYRLMRGLTANQRNQMSATYSHPAFTPAQKRLSLSYLTTTTLNAVITPRLNIDMTYSRNIKPRGDYTPGADGSPSLFLSDESRDYVVNANLSYRPHHSVSFRVNPIYQAIQNDGTSLGQAVPKRRSRTFTLNAEANLNLQLARSARLTGRIGRALNAMRVVQYSSGRAEPGPRSEFDHWTGSLQLSWDL